MEHVKQFNKEDILNKKDDQGNTILHLAVSKKLYEVVDLVFNEHIVTKGAMEVNPLNERGLTPLDVLVVLFQNEEGDREIEEILRRAGAVMAKDLHSLPEVVLNQNQQASANNNNPSRTEQRRSPSKQLLEYFKYDEINDSPSKVRSTLLVIAIPIATATYQAVLSPPGGVWQDDYSAGSNSHNGSTNSVAPYTAGKAVMGSHNCFSYCLFLLFNSIGFFTSLDMINILTAGFPLRLELQVSIVALIVTYDTCMFAIAPCHGVTLFFTVISAVMPFVVPIAALVVRNHLRKPLDALPSTNLASA